MSKTYQIEMSEERLSAVIAALELHTSILKGDFTVIADLVFQSKVPSRGFSSVEEVNQAMLEAANKLRIYRPLHSDDPMLHKEAKLNLNTIQKLKVFLEAT